MLYADLRDEYRRLWDTSQYDPKFSSAGQATARKIVAAKSRYQQIETATGVPWFVIGCVHALESGCRFGTHLHNGDPLTARTRLVPAGRPKAGKPPFTWEESAIDACQIKNWHQISAWPVERILYECERYNGWGYRKYHKDVLSPYLWSGIFPWGQKPGKYIADGKWSSTARSGQTGIVCLLKRCAELDDSIVFAFDEPLAPDVVPLPERPVIEDIVPETYPKAEEPRVAEAAQQSRTVTGALVAGVGTLTAYADDAMQTLMETAAQVSAWSPIQNLMTTAGVHVKGIGFSLAIGGLALVVGRRFSAAARGKEG